jgi:predicted nucleic acid-binding protein
VLARVHELRHNMTALDACYVALAESLDVIALTSDARWASVPGVRTTIEVV